MIIFFCSCSGLADLIKVYIHVIPVSTTPPTIDAPIEFTVDEIAAIGSEIGHIKCYDSDSIDQGRLNLEITSGNGL